MRSFRQDGTCRLMCRKENHAQCGRNGDELRKEGAVRAEMAFGA